MQETLYPLDLPPGLYHNGTVYQARGRWHTGNLVRFLNGKILPVGAWSQHALTGVTLTGTTNAMLAWDDGTDAYIAFGTTTGLFVASGSVLYDITPTGEAGGSPTRTWQLALFGADLVATRQTTVVNQYGNLYIWSRDTSAVATRAVAEGSYPTSGYGVAVTPERFLVQLGGIDSSFDLAAHSRRVYWASQETSDDWDFADDTNTAGFFDLSTAGSLRCGHASRGQTLLWTTRDLWTMTYIGGDFIFSFAQVGGHCGIIGAKAAVVIDTAAYWMGVNRFFKYDGFVQPIPCDVEQYVFEDFNTDAADTVWALANPLFSEVWWFYPSADATTPDRYVAYNYNENHWTFGALARCAGVTITASGRVGPELIDADNVLYYHELSTPADETTPFLESGPMELDEGNHVARVQRIVPDGNVAGALSAYLYTAMYPEETEVLNGPYTLVSPTSVRLTAKQFRLRIEQTVASGWKLGVVRLGAIMGGKR